MTFIEVGMYVIVKRIFTMKIKKKDSNDLIKIIVLFTL